LEGNVKRVLFLFYKRRHVKRRERKGAEEKERVRGRG